MKKNKSLFQSLLDMICTRKEEIKFSKLEEDIKRVRKHREKIKFNSFTKDEMVEIDQWRALAKVGEEAQEKYRHKSFNLLKAIFDNPLELDQEVDDDALGTWVEQFKKEDKEEV